MDVPRSRRRPVLLTCAVGVETSPGGADLWAGGRPYRLHVEVRAEGVDEACTMWRETYGPGHNICASANPAHVEVVRLRRLPC